MDGVAPFMILELCFATAGGIVGKLKGSSFWTWFMISLIPVLGLITALCWRFENEELRRQCPTCGKLVMLHDALCVRCGNELEFPEVAIASEAAMARARKTPPRPPRARGSIN